MQSVYCDLLGIDLSLFSEGIRELMEEDLKKNITDKVMAIHPYKLPSKEEYIEKGRCKTHVNDPNKKEGRKTIYATSEEEMLEKLYKHYFGDKNGRTFEQVFRDLIDHYKQFHTLKDSTIKDHEGQYARFFADDPYSQKALSSITVADTASFLDRAHLRISEKDRKRGQNVIEKHRHNSIRTIITMVYGYANQYEQANLINRKRSIMGRVI